MSYREALTEALRTALRDDDRVIVLGQDVGARGGAYGVTAGLWEEFGAQRVRDAPRPRRRWSASASGRRWRGCGRWSS